MRKAAFKPSEHVSLIPLSNKLNDTNIILSWYLRNRWCHSYD